MDFLKNGYRFFCTYPPETLVRMRQIYILPVVIIFYKDTYVKINIPRLKI